MTSLEWLAKLVSFDTTSRNSNLDLITALANWLNDQRLDTRLTYDLDGQKANLFATLPAHDGTVDGGLILSGHTDVVPVDGQQWDTDPFQATEKEGRIYGRGTCDMKGFLAVALALIPEFRQYKLARPLHLAFSYDEEVGCKGAPLLIADFQQYGLKPSACIVGEPTDMRLVVAHKGIRVLRCRVRGLATHSSLVTEGCNAIEYAARLICYLRDLADQLKQNSSLDHHYDIPFTSMTTNLVQGGNASNIIPSYCEFSFEFRHLPDLKPDDLIHQIKSYVAEDLLPKMRKEYPGASIEIDLMGAAPAFEASEQAEITQQVRAITGEEDKRKVAYATEAGLFQQAGIPTILCGPGNIEQAHRPNEYVMVEQLRRCEDFLRQVVT